jgi:hypothetical protein
LQGDGDKLFVLFQGKRLRELHKVMSNMVIWVSLIDAGFVRDETTLQPSMYLNKYVLGVYLSFAQYILRLCSLSFSNYALIHVTKCSSSHVLIHRLLVHSLSQFVLSFCFFFSLSVFVSLSCHCCCGLFLASSMAKSSRCF